MRLAAARAAPASAPTSASGAQPAGRVGAGGSIVRSTEVGSVVTGGRPQPTGLRPSPGVDDLAVLHADDALGGRGHVVVVGDHEDRLAARVEAAEQLDDLVAALGVEGAGGLVGQQQRRLVGQGPGDGQALALAAGERPGRRLGLVGQAEQVEQVAAAGLGRLALRARRPWPGRATFSSTVMPSSRLKNWNTMPMWRRRMRASSSSVLPVTSSSASTIVPSSAWSRPATRLSSVDLPQPDGPMMATNSPRRHLEVVPRERAHRGVLGLEGAAHAPHVEHDVGGLASALGEGQARSVVMAGSRSLVRSGRW